MRSSKNSWMFLEQLIMLLRSDPNREEQKKMVFSLLSRQAGQGVARLGAARRGKAGKAGRGAARRGKAGRAGKAGRGVAGRGPAWQGRQGGAWLGAAWLGLARQARHKLLFE
jgi:hypothetical protein